MFHVEQRPASPLEQALFCSGLQHARVEGPLPNCGESGENPSNGDNPHGYRHLA